MCVALTEWVGGLAAPPAAPLTALSALPPGDAPADLRHLPAAVSSAMAAACARTAAAGPAAPGCGAPADASPRLAGGAFTRCFYDADLPLSAPALERSLLDGSGGAGAAIAVPVARVGHRGSRLALQVQFDVEG